MTRRLLALVVSTCMVVPPVNGALLHRHDEHKIPPPASPTLPLGGEGAPATASASMADGSSTLIASEGALPAVAGLDGGAPVDLESMPPAPESHDSARELQPGPATGSTVGLEGAEAGGGTAGLTAALVASGGVRGYIEQRFEAWGLAHRWGPGWGRLMARVSSCETIGSRTGEPNVRAVGRVYGERGLFQIHPVHRGEIEAWTRWTWDDMFEVEANVEMAMELLLRQGLGAWAASRWCWN